MEQFWSFIDNVIMYCRKQTSTTPYEAIFPTLVHLRCSLKLWERSVIQLTTVTTDLTFTIAEGLEMTTLYMPSCHDFVS